MSKKSKGRIRGGALRENVLLVVLGILAAVMIAAQVIVYFGSSESLDTKIKRAEFGEPGTPVRAVAEIEYNGEIIRKNIELSIEPKSLTDEEKRQRLDECCEALPKIILGDNRSIEEITEDMDLITYHEKTGVTLKWDSSESELIDNEGVVYPVAEDETGKYVLLTAIVYIDGEETEWKCNVRHEMVLTEDNCAKSLERELYLIQKAVNEDTSGEYVELPDAVASGERIKWSVPSDTRYVMAAVIVLLSMFFLVYKRKKDREKAVEARHQEIIREFPYFLDKLVMLLSAGLILSDAVYRIAEDYSRFYTGRQKKVLYDELCEAVRSMKESNSSFSDELIRLADRLEVREFARLAIILRDSLESGMALVGKLEGESILLWQERKTTVQKLGRIADTKLIFPLMVILLVLIVIVMTPALMQM